MLIAIFPPHRFGITEYGKYNTGKLKDKFRAIIVLKSNFSQANFKVPLLFLGNCSFYEELPSPEELKLVDYERYDKM